MDARASNNPWHQRAYEPLPNELCEQIYDYCMPDFSPRMLHFVVVQFTITPRTCTVSPGPTLAKDTRPIRNLLCSRRDLRMYGLLRYPDTLPVAILPRTTPTQGKKSKNLIHKAKYGSIRFCAAIDHVYISDIYLPQRGDGCSLSNIRYDILPGFINTVQNLTLSLGQMKQFNASARSGRDMRGYWGTNYLRWNVLLGMFPNLKKLYFPAGWASYPVYPSLFASRGVCDHALWYQRLGGQDDVIGCWPKGRETLDWGLEQSNVYVLDTRRLSSVYSDYVRDYLPDEISGRCQVLPMITLQLQHFDTHGNKPIERLSDVNWRDWCISTPPRRYCYFGAEFEIESTTDFDSELDSDTNEGDRRTQSALATDRERPPDNRRRALEKATRKVGWTYFGALMKVPISGWRMEYVTGNGNISSALGENVFKWALLCAAALPRLGLDLREFRR